MNTDKVPEYATFETVLKVRPDDIDMFNHVHSSRYMDYVLAARFEQMERCYGMGWGKFIERGLGWFMVATEMNFRRQLALGEEFAVRTRIGEYSKDGVRVEFEINRHPTGKRCCDGWADYKLIDLGKGRAVELPEDVKPFYLVKRGEKPGLEVM